MASVSFRSLVASCLSAALVVATAPAFAAPATATLTGTVYADDVTTPLAGAMVIVTDANGAKIESRPTGADGRFTVPDVASGRTELALQTKDGSFAVATPVTLAPGETRGVHLALKGGKAKSKGGTAASGGSGMTGGAIGAMTAVLVGFVAAGVMAADQSNNPKEASPYVPPTDK